MADHKVERKKAVNEGKTAKSNAAIITISNTTPQISMVALIAQIYGIITHFGWSGMEQGMVTD